MAALNETFVASGKKGKTKVCAVRRSITGQVQIMDLTAFLNIAEKTGIITSSFQGKSADGMPLSQKNSAKRGNGCKIGSAQIKIFFQYHNFIL